MPDTVLLAAIGALAGAIGVLWRQLLVERRDRDAEKRTDARLIFALLGERAKTHGEPYPPTMSTPERPNSVEARSLAVRALNGDVETLLRDYLDGPPTKNERRGRKP